MYSGGNKDSTMTKMLNILINLSKVEEMMNATSRKKKKDHSSHWTFSKDDDYA